MFPYSHPPYRAPSFLSPGTLTSARAHCLLYIFFPPTLCKAPSPIFLDDSCLLHTVGVYIQHNGFGKWLSRSGSRLWYPRLRRSSGPWAWLGILIFTFLLLCPDYVPTFQLQVTVCLLYLGRVRAHGNARWAAPAISLPALLLAYDPLSYDEAFLCSRGSRFFMPGTTYDP